MNAIAFLLAAAIFASGFETGDTSEWDEVVGPPPSAVPTLAQTDEALAYIHSNIRVGVGEWDQPRWGIDILAATPTRPADHIGTVDLTPGWATFGYVVPQGEAPASIEVFGLPSQADVKVRWPDGSVRFVILTALVPAAAQYQVRAAPANLTAPFGLGALPDISVVITQGGTYTAQPSAPADEWLSGPLVRQWRTTVASHPQLRVEIDLAVYQGGASTVRATVANSRQGTAGKQENYSVDVQIGGQSAFSRSGVQHGWMTRWTKKFEQGQFSTVSYDFSPFQRAGALPQYYANMDHRSINFGSTYDILGRGGNAGNDMSGVGGRRELGPYPDDTARYLVHQGQPYRDFVIRNGELAGSWPVHLREDDGSLITLDEEPEFWFDGRGPDGARPMGDLTQVGPLKPDNAHQPSWVYVPYLITGDRYFADEMASWASYCLSYAWNWTRGGPGSGMPGVFIPPYPNSDQGEGLMIPASPNQIRGSAWTLRNIVDAAAYLPDGYTEKPYFADRLQRNIAWMEWAVTVYQPPVPTLVYPLIRSEGIDESSLWRLNYLAWAIYHIGEQGWTGGDDFLRYLSQFQTKLFTSEPEFDRGRAAIFILDIRKRTNGQPVWFGSMAELNAANLHRGVGGWVSDYAMSSRLSVEVYRRRFAQ